jgi:alpha-ribazole phosphatase
MSIYLIRHTTPLVEKGTCYGQSDLEVTDQFPDEAGIIQQYIPTDIESVYSSPLLRCRKLAEYLFPQHSIRFEHDLKELHCGEWEMLRWDDIPKEVIDPWMKDFVNVTIPGGESFVVLFSRVSRCFEEILATGKTAAIVAHGGVIRSILAHITHTPLKDSFAAFSLHYGCVVRLDVTEHGIQHEILSNISTVQEQHRPGHKLSGK